MNTRSLLLAAATATAMVAASFSAWADAGAGSQNTTSVGTHQTSHSSTSSVGSSGTQSAYSSGGPASAASSGGGAARGASVNGNTYGGAAGGNSGWATATSTAKPPKPPLPTPVPRVFGGAGSPLACTVAVKDFRKWRRLDRDERALALNCECLTVEPDGLARNAAKECPQNAGENLHRDAELSFCERRLAACRFPDDLSTRPGASVCGVFGS